MNVGRCGDITSCRFRLTLDTFKNRLDKFWQDQEVLYNWKADICTGSRKLSQCYFRLINKPLILCYARSGHRGLLDLRSDIFSTTTTTTTTTTVWKMTSAHLVRFSIKFHTIESILPHCRVRCSSSPRCLKMWWCMCYVLSAYLHSSLRYLL